VDELNAVPAYVPPYLEDCFEDFSRREGMNRKGYQRNARLPQFLGSNTGRPEAGHMRRKSAAIQKAGGFRELPFGASDPCLTDHHEDWNRLCDG
jgi:hypothetical protein